MVLKEKYLSPLQVTFILRISIYPSPLPKIPYRRINKRGREATYERGWNFVPC